MAQKNSQGASPYNHAQESVQRPGVGVEAQFSHKKETGTRRYDPSLPPELSWDESADRAFADWLIGLVADAAERGKDKVFAEPRIWQGTEERFSSLSECVARLRSLTKPFLNGTGKAERQQVSVPTSPLFVHERHSTQAILETPQFHKARGTTLDLFGDIGLDIADKLEAYEHKGPWTNRLALGDSPQVLNSLLEYEGMGGQVQMLYFDPPYGVKFGSNFQPFVRKNRVTHGSDDDGVKAHSRFYSSAASAWMHLRKQYPALLQALFRGAIRLLKRDGDIKSIVLSDREAREQAVHHIFDPAL